jgi:hypothetical protein
MNEWAVVKDGHIVNVITTRHPKRDLQQRYPAYEIVALADLPAKVLKDYRFWDERP